MKKSNNHNQILNKMENFEQLPVGHKIAEEVAIKEFKEFVDFFTDDEIEESDVKAKYPQALKAVQLGLLTFDDNHIPTLTLRDAIRNDADQPSITTLTFRTRITATDQQRLSSGVNMKKEELLWTHKCFAFIIKQPLAILDKLSRFDYKVAEQVTTLFL